MYTGIAAKLTLVTGTGDSATEEQVAYISNFSIEETRDIIEVTHLGSKTKEKEPMQYSWTASADGTADFENGAGQLALRQAMVNGDKVKVKFYLNTTRFLTGDAYIDSLSIDMSAEDKANISISLSGNGELTTNSI